jgi:hypothetical protein
MSSKPDSSDDKTTVLSNSIHKALRGKPADLKEMQEMVQTISHILQSLRLTEVQKMFIKHRLECLTEVIDAGGPAEYLQLIQNEILKHIEP